MMVPLAFQSACILANQNISHYPSSTCSVDGDPDRLPGYLCKSEAG